MKKFALFAVLALAALLAPGFAAAQGTTGVNPQVAALPHIVDGIFMAPAYATYGCGVLSGNTSTGAGTSIVVNCQGTGVTLRDGSVLPFPTVFNTNTPVQIADSNAEVFTPTAASIAPCPAGNLGVGGSQNCVTLTGTIANTHGQSAPVISGDNGVFEAITDAGNQGGGVVFWQVDTGIVTLNTGGLTTTSTAKVPTNFYNAGASARVTTTITTTTNWAVGISGATGIFASANTTLTAGTTALANQAAPASTGTTSALTAILVTCTVANPGAGALKARVWGYTPVQAAN